MEPSKSALSIGLASVGASLLALLAVDRKDVSSEPGAPAPLPVAVADFEPPQVSPPVRDGMLREGAAVELGNLAPRLGAQDMEALRPRPRPAKLVRSSAPVRPKPRPEVNADSTIVASPRPRPRDPLVELVARRATEWPTLGTRSKVPASEPASRRARLLAQAESLLDAPPRTLRNATALTCLAVSVYHEARNQPELGQHAVAAVILRRAEVPHRWEDTICEVVRPSQFSYLAPDFGFAEIDEPKAWRGAVAVAVSAMLNGPHPDLAQADHYHRVDIAPAWNETMDVVARVADHVFLRDPRSQRID